MNKPIEITKEAVEFAQMLNNLNGYSFVIGNCDEPNPIKNECGGYYCSEDVGHIDCKHVKQQHFCCTPGLTMDGVEFKECPNALGGTYWKAISQIGTIFGSEVEGELVGIGKTKEIALERLGQERKKLHESLWY